MSIRTYGIDEIDTVKERHRTAPSSVVCSWDNGQTWQSVPDDQLKWLWRDWKFAFIELKAS